jgi:DMSO/TMAO reductase YedYZ molybdopterin-dependent catalytic subunit
VTEIAEAPTRLRKLHRWSVRAMHWTNAVAMIVMIASGWGITADNYPSIIDMPSALHPQTLLALDCATETLPDPFGVPLRLRTSTKLGFKFPKWIASIEATNDYRPGYLEEKGFNFSSGIRGGRL